MNQLLFDIAEQHRADMLADAMHTHHLAEYRLTQRHDRMYARVLAWMGERFIAWGWRLRARYGKVEHQHAL